MNNDEYSKNNIDFSKDKEGEAPLDESSFKSTQLRG